VSKQKQNLLTSLANNSVTQTNVSFSRRHPTGAAILIVESLTIKYFAGCITGFDTGIVLILLRHRRNGVAELATIKMTLALILQTRNSFILFSQLHTQVCGCT
jgi:hypothetical protein